MSLTILGRYEDMNTSVHKPTFGAIFGWLRQAQPPLRRQRIITFDPMKYLFPLLCLTLLPFFSDAQAPSDSLRQFKTDSNIIQDKRVNELILKHVMINEARKEKMKGYRVQIHFGPERAKALDIKTKFDNAHSDISSYLKSEMPYFKIRIGDYRTKLEAYKALQSIIGDFPGAFIVQDEIELPKL